MELREALVEYKIFTEKLIELAKKEEFDLFEELLDNREDIIDKMKNLKYTKSQFSDYIEELSIMKLEEELKVIMSEKKDVIRNEIERLAQTRNANSMYKRKDYTKASYFNEKI